MGSQQAQQLWPSDVVLLVEQRLGGGRVGQLAEKVFALPIGQACLVHLPGEPLAAVGPNLDRKRQPGLHAGKVARASCKAGFPG
jgi:hypothetical protein